MVQGTGGVDDIDVQFKGVSPEWLNTQKGETLTLEPHSFHFHLFEKLLSPLWI